MDKDTGRLESGVGDSRSEPVDSGIDSTPTDKRCGRTGRGYKTVRRLLYELTDFTVYEYVIEVVTLILLGRESLSEFCRPELARDTGRDARWLRTSLIMWRGRGLDGGLIGGEKLPDLVGLAISVGYCQDE